MDDAVRVLTDTLGRSRFAQVLDPEGRLLVADILPADNPQKAVLMEYKKDYEE